MSTIARCGTCKHTPSLFRDGYCDAGCEMFYGGGTCPKYDAIANNLIMDDLVYRPSAYCFVKESVRQTYLPWPQDVIFNAPATVVFWDDGSKTVVKLMDGEEFNPEVGLAMCFCKKVMGNGYKRWFKDALKKGRWQ